MRPLSTLWSGLENIKKTIIQTVQVPIEQLMNTVEKTILLIRKVYHLVTYQRRLDILLNLVKSSEIQLSLFTGRRLYYYKRVIVIYIEKKIRTRIGQVEKSMTKTIGLFRGRGSPVIVRTSKEILYQFHQKICMARGNGGNLSKQRSCLIEATINLRGTTTQWNLKAKNLKISIQCLIYY